MRHFFAARLQPSRTVLQARRVSSCGVRMAMAYVCHVRVLYQNEWPHPQMFSPSDSHAILVFLHQTIRQYSDEDPHWCQMQVGYEKSRFSTNIAHWYDLWSVECCQQISTVEWVDNSKHRLRLRDGDMVKIETGSRILIWRTVVFPNRK